MNKKQLKLTIPLPTSVNHIYGRNKFGSTFLKKEGKYYKINVGEYIKKEVEKQEWVKLLEGEYCFLDEVVYMNTKGRDADNLKKLQQDTITEALCVWHDDTLCLPRTNRIYIDKNNPRIELVITKTNTIGIFESIEECESFENICVNCGNFRGGSCRKLKDIKDNRIIEEVKLMDSIWNCLSYKDSKNKQIKFSEGGK